MIRAFVLVSVKGFPLFEQYFNETTMDKDQEIIDEIAENADAYLHEPDGDIMQFEKQSVKRSRISEDSWLVLISDNPEIDYTSHDLNDLKKAATLIKEGDPHAIEYVLSGFIHPFN